MKSMSSFRRLPHGRRQKGKWSLCMRILRTGNGLSAGGISECADGTEYKGYRHQGRDYTGEPNMHTGTGRGICESGGEFHGGNEVGRNKV